MFKMKLVCSWLLLLQALVVSSSLFAEEHVILISVDGLRPAAISQLGETQLPNFYRFREQGVWTDNARTDFDYTRTLPNHSSMLTARPVTGKQGHGQTSNSMPTAETTLHNNTGEEAYVTSIFDVVHDHGLTTALYVSKDKFVLFEQSYNEQAGATDTVGENNGTDKIDRYVFLSPDRTADALVSQYLVDMSEELFNFSFIHLVDTDSAGHGNKWQTDGYLDSVKRIDGYLGKIFALVDTNGSLSDNTAIILVADHGGAGRAHGDAEDFENYQIPFYVWSTEVSVGRELYDLNSLSRTSPGQARPDYSTQGRQQPIRNGDAANLSLQLLGLPAISDPGAIINSNQDLLIKEAR